MTTYWFDKEEVQFKPIKQTRDWNPIIVLVLFIICLAVSIKGIMLNHELRELRQSKGCIHGPVKEVSELYFNEYMDTPTRIAFKTWHKRNRE